jgi:hypothetical protein
VDVILKLQESLAQDLVQFERSVNYDTLSEKDLEEIAETYEKIYLILHEIRVNT